MTDISDRLQRLIDLQSQIIDLAQIKRRMPYPDRKTSDYYENDVEHSFALAMAAWFLGDFYPHLSKELLIKYALVHDFVEIYAGDEMVIGRTPEAEMRKREREHLALQTLSELWHDFPEGLQAIDNYEKRDSPESRFIYALDKIMPDILNVLSEGKGYRVFNITPEMLIAAKDSKIALSDEVSELWSSLKEVLRENPDYFPKEQTNALLYCTTNEIKFRVGKRICSVKGIDLVQNPVEVNEIQSTNADELIQDKSRKVYEKVQRAVLVNDHFWEIPALNGFPGAYTKHVNQWFSADDWLALVRDKPNKEIFLVSKLCFVNGEETKVFTGRSRYVFRSSPSSGPGISLLKSISEEGSSDSLQDTWSKNPDLLNIDEPVWQEFTEWYKNQK